MTLETALAVTAVVASIGGLIFGIYKLRPESTRIFVDSAKVSVELADKGRDELRDKVAELNMILVEKELENRSLKDELEHCEGERERLQGQDGGPT